jgi:hypothetical protein
MNDNKDSAIDPIFIRSEGLYITVWGDIASVTDSSLKSPKKQFIKVDGQNRKYLTFHKRKIILDI